MSKAQELVDNAEKNSIGIPINIHNLITQLMKNKNISRKQASREMYISVVRFRKGRPPINGLGNLFY